MKYNDLKIFKFSTISRKFNRIRDSFSRIYKNIKHVPKHAADLFGFIAKSISSEITNSIKFVIKYLLKIIILIDPRRLNFKKIYIFFDIRRYDFYRVDKKINFTKYKYLPMYFVVFIIFIGFTYVAMPIFYNYDKSELEKNICKNHNIECLIRGKVNYSFYPSPRIKIKELTINDFTKKKHTSIAVEEAAIILSIKNLLNKKKQNFKKIELNNFEININVKNLKKYKNIFTKKINFIPVTFVKGKIVFFDGKNYVASINNANLNLILEEDSKESILKGEFLNGNIYINLNTKKIDDKASTDLILKMSDLNLFTKANFFNYEKDKGAINGNILIKKDKYRFTGIFDYKDNEITINKSNLRNIFLNGELEGKIRLLPYFDFNLDLSLNSLNFTKLYNYFLTLDLDKENQKNLFKINKKINGKLGLSSEKIYSSYNLVKSFESRIEFSNGNILVEQCLFNLGKLGAADISGVINNDKKFTNFKYDSNIFVDNQKKFLNKFGIYNKKSIFSNLFVSGNFDLQNIRNSFYEISDNEKLSNDDVNFIEKEFNEFVLSDGYKNLFRFPRFKEFVKLITSETN
tara:strand:+ start:1117 stop:2841 length:1725 start_codon:yes stop_codon:yes gene_type:complete